MSAIQPYYPRFIKWLKLLGPDVVLVQSHAAERMFASVGCRAVLVPNGVDTHKFQPTPSDRKLVLRDKYQVPLAKYVVLHVGAIKAGRNVQLLASLQDEKRLVIVVGRPSELVEQRVLEQLRQRGCVVWTNYFSTLEEIYGLSDCYVFPCISKRNSIELPLSVLEAMSCNLPIVTTRFGALPETFSEGEGMVFVEDEKALIHGVYEIGERTTAVATRSMILPFSWDSITRRIEEIYDELAS
jgi:glycosyltransferase involved in cell wall biosynthesis